ncbi:MAG: sulfatase-like hydrolase/transferase, partial [Leptolyngbyaceae cyanobacterium SM1_3_5]|nr:sulfatase-like hydrolase/transferase [Leptolyngbyaceae cyanobacterium SM1_3_5]
RADATRPNIVFLLIDDLGYADCGFNGGTEIKTPRIDALAAGGTIIESHYVQPVCSPTRSVADDRSLPDPYRCLHGRAAACGVGPSAAGAHPRGRAERCGLHYRDHRQVAPRRV